MKTEHKKFNIVIPVYFNELNLRITYDAILKRIQSSKDKYEYEIVFVDDGSEDNSFNELLSIHTQDPAHVKVIKLTRNFGQVMAILAGFTECDGDCVIVMSADLQDPPDLILKMLKEWDDNNNKIVIAARQDREDGIISRMVSKLFYGLTRKFAIPNMPKGGFDYFLIDKDVKEILKSSNEKNSFLQGQILWVGYPVKVLKYTRRKREIGRSTWTIAKKIKYFIDGFMTTTYFPIRLISGAGIIISTLGFLYAILIFILRVFSSIPIKGWAPLMIVILVLSGFQMMMLGIIGEYLWRTYDETRKRPTFIIEKIIK